MIRVLLAEDQAMVLGALSALLGLESDIEVVGAAADGETAWRDVQRLKPDVLVTDIEMPEMNGFEFAENIRSDHNLNQLPIIALSAMVSPTWAPGLARCASTSEIWFEWFSTLSTTSMCRDSRSSPFFGSISA